ncbi:hypothetical protein [uncultured Sulfitobacter sp.]|uniref:hypothetical protein n=1 Tax=uncultured Sulfitobacter sp. TaxID=191468 RepID=UPI00261FB55F|nr:hypothetical protein [uncultured Sulfitobacter sp.]
MRKDYSLPESVLGFLKVIGWLGVALGICAGIIMAFAMGTLLPIALAFGGVVSCVLLVAFAQIGSAQIDTAKSVSEMVEMMKRANAGLGQQDAPISTAKRAQPSSRIEHGETVHKGHRITSSGSLFVAMGEKFVSLDQARKFIDGLEN